MDNRAIIAGSFDPIHFGHIDIIKRAAQAFNLMVVVANNPAKKYMFSLEERVKMVQHSLRPSVLGSGLTNVNGIPLKAPIVVVAALTDTNKLLADFAFEYGIKTIVRGVRNFADYDFEKMMRDINISQQNGIETYFLSGDPKLSHVSSTAVKELYAHAGFIHEYVPLWVKRALEVKNGVEIIGVTGNIASGKNWYCEHLRAAGQDVFHLDVDKLAHFILFQSVNTPAHQAVRVNIRKTFLMDSSIGIECDSDPLTELERNELGNKVFADVERRLKLNAIMYQPLMTAIRRAVVGKKGIVLVNTALLAEFGMTHICNNNVVLVTTDNTTRLERLKARGLNPTQIKHRLESQYNDDRKQYHIACQSDKDHYGKILVVHNDVNYGYAAEQALSDFKDFFGIKQVRIPCNNS